MSWIDLIILLVYVIILAVITVFRRKDQSDEAEFLLSGRKLSLPAFIGTLVSTWYGGILGIGEYTAQFGVSQWVIFGLPYYFFSMIFAVFLAKKIRESQTMSIPEGIRSVYGNSAGQASALSVFLLVSPAPYLLMTGLLFSYFFSMTDHVVFIMILVTVISSLYVSYGGFSAVVKTDVLQLVLMFSGFYVLLFYAWTEMGSPWSIALKLPDIYTDISGGHSALYLLIWFFIAMWTFVDPSFHQRCMAARSPRVAKQGIFYSVLFWFVFDMATLATALYGRYLIGPMDNPAMVYPLMAEILLPDGLRGFFMLALLATIMSTLDSYLFLSGQTLGRDVLAHHFNRSPVFLSRTGILISAISGIGLAILFPSVVSLWYVIGSVVLPGLLLPVIGMYYPVLRIKAKYSVLFILLPSGISLVWMIAGMAVTNDLYSYAYLGIEPFYPGLMSSFLFYSIFRVPSKSV